MTHFESTEIYRVTEKQAVQRAYLRLPDRWKRDAKVRMTRNGIEYIPDTFELLQGVLDEIERNVNERKNINIDPVTKETSQIDRGRRINAIQGRRNYDKSKLRGNKFGIRKSTFRNGYKGTKQIKRYSGNPRGNANARYRGYKGNYGNHNKRNYRNIGSRRYGYQNQSRMNNSGRGQTRYGYKYRGNKYNNTRGRTRNMNGKYQRKVMSVPLPQTKSKTGYTRKSTVCFKCGRQGHWSNDCDDLTDQERDELEKRLTNNAKNARSFITKGRQEKMSNLVNQILDEREREQDKARREAIDLTTNAIDVQDRNGNRYQRTVYDKSAQQQEMAALAQSTNPRRTTRDRS